MELKMSARKLENWLWRDRFKSLEDATEYLLNYATDLGPLALQCLKRLKNKEVKLQELTKENISLKLQIKEVIANEYTKRRSKD